MDSGSTPQRIGRGHSSDQGFDRGVDGRVACRGAPGERGPVTAKAVSLQRSTVAGETMTRACLQAGHTLDSQTQRSRSLC